jgi:SAM-dependent methyltransferase
MGYGVRARINRPWQPVGGGMAIHRYYTEEFLKTVSNDIRGHCLEFGEDSYSSKFSGGKIDKLDVLNVEDSAPGSTIIADLTKPNQIPSDQFDCIVCTYVLHCIWDYVAALRDMKRILKPGGVLLGCVPFVMGYAANCGEAWRFSPEGLDRLLEEAFGPGAAEIHLYGNSLAATADVRGLAADKFKKEELDFVDPRYAVLITFRVVKR